MQRSMDTRTVKIGFCQTAPRHRDVAHNMAFVDEWLDGVEPGTLDILVLPELAFTGYTFTSPSDIEPYLEPATSDGATVAWCTRTARRLHCWVMAGFPSVDPATGKRYNSMCVADRAENVAAVYHKFHLFETDEAWASEGPSFRVLKGTEFGTLGFGICMDLNPKQFQTSYYLCEFANYHKTKGTDLVVCSMAWLRSKSDDDTDREPSMSADESARLVAYWIDRLRPLDKSGCAVAVCNRLGREGADTEFAGSSAVIQFHADGIEAGHCGGEEGLYVMEIPMPKRVDLDEAGVTEEEEEEEN
ncbi:hypothetical protein H9P43_006148 [Blastocladiella emersonii ATCC 22665]|nr:hypothetical protein H9P43_006148 [Blastocladiella emersonii ATCC 22665]